MILIITSRHEAAVSKITKSASPRQAQACAAIRGAAGHHKDGVDSLPPREVTASDDPPDERDVSLQGQEPRKDDEDQDLQGLVPGLCLPGSRRAEEQCQDQRLQSAGHKLQPRMALKTL